MTKKSLKPKSSDGVNVQDSNFIGPTVIAGRDANVNQDGKLNPILNDIAILRQYLSEISREHQEFIDDTEDSLEELENSLKENKPYEKLEIKGKRLKKAAENLANVVPEVATISTKIVEAILEMGSGS